MPEANSAILSLMVLTPRDYQYIQELERIASRVPTVPARLAQRLDRYDLGFVLSLQQGYPWKLHVSSKNTGFRSTTVTNEIVVVNGSHRNEKHIYILGLVLHRVYTAFY